MTSNNLQNSQNRRGNVRAARALPFAEEGPSLPGQASELPRTRSGNQRICEDRDDDLYSSNTERLTERQIKSRIERLNWRNEKDRVETFLIHGHRYTLLIKSLAANGLFCNVNGDLECFCCHFVIGRHLWDNRTDFRTLHHESKRNSCCRFLDEEDCGNIPLNYPREHQNQDQALPVQGASAGALTPNVGRNGSTSMPSAGYAGFADNTSLGITSSAYNTPPRTPRTGMDCCDRDRPSVTNNYYGQVINNYGIRKESGEPLSQGQGINQLLTPPTTPQGRQQTPPCCTCGMRPVQGLDCGHSFACASCLGRFSRCPSCP